MFENPTKFVSITPLIPEKLRRIYYRDCLCESALERKWHFKIAIAKGSVFSHQVVSSIPGRAFLTSR